MSLFDDHFTEVLAISGRKWVRLDEVAKLMPDPDTLGLVDPEMLDLLRQSQTDGVRAVVLMWQKEVNQMGTLTSQSDLVEVAEALEFAAKRYRDPSRRGSRGTVDLS